MRAAALAFFLALLLANTAQGAVSVTENTIHYKGERSEINVRYPQTGIAAIDRVLSTFAKSAADYVHPKDAPSEDNAQSVSVAYRVFRNDDRMIGIELDGSVYYGGPHGLPIGQNFTFLLPDGGQVLLPDLVDGKRGLNKVSELAIADIARQLRAKGHQLDADDLRNLYASAGPEGIVHTAFEWQRDELVLRFGSYELGGGYADSHIVHIPLADLSDVIRRDLRAPVSTSGARTPAP